MPVKIAQASRRMISPKLSRKIYLQWVLALVALMVLTTFCHRWLASQPVSHVRFEGNMHYTNKASLQAAVSPWLAQGMLHLPIRQIQAAVLADKWVDDVQLRKLWPNTLMLKVVEQRPVASWGKGAYLNYRGEAFFPRKTIHDQGLPTLTGPEGKGAAILQVYQHLSAVSAPRGLKVIELHQDRLDNFHATLSNDIALNLGANDVQQNINKFADLFDRHLNVSQVAVAAIDLRYGNGAAVAWQQDTDLALAGSALVIKPQGEFYER